MARANFRQPDIFPTITALVTAPDTLAGGTWRCVLGLLGMTFDNRPDQAALISAVFGAAFGGDTPPAGVVCRLLADAYKSDYASGFDPRQSPLGSISFELQFASDFAGMTNVPITFTCAGIATDAPADADITLPTITGNTTDITLLDYQAGALPHGFYSEAVEGAALTTISGEETITDLDIGNATEIHVDHSGDATFAFCEYPYITVPSGVRVTVLASSSDAHKTDGSNFVLLVENVSYATDGGYGDSSPDVALSWARTGQVA